MTALRRVVRAPGLIAVVGAISLLLAWHVGGMVRAAGAAAMTDYAWPDDGHVMYAVLELFATHPGTAAVAARGLLAAGLLWIAVQALLQGAMVRRLSGSASAADVAAAGVRFAPGVCVQTGWTLLVRALPLALVGLAAGALPPLALALSLAVGAAGTVVADVARARVVLAGAHPFHPRTTLVALRTVFTRPRLLATATTIAIVQMLLPPLVFAAVFTDVGGGAAIWIGRALVLVGTVFGLWRIALAVEAVEPRPRE